MQQVVSSYPKSESLPFFYVAEAGITVRALHADEALNAWNLHNHVRQNLPEEKKGFLLPKAQSYFTDFAKRKGGILWGAFSGEQLVGIAALAEYSNFGAAHKEKAITSPNATRVSLSYGDRSLSVVQSFCVNKETACQGTSSALLTAIELYAETTEASHLIAQTAQANQAALACFYDAGYSIADGWEGPDHARYLLHKSLRNCLRSVQRLAS